MTQHNGCARPFHIRVDRALTHPQVLALLEEHLAGMQCSPIPLVETIVAAYSAALKRWDDLAFTQRLRWTALCRRGLKNKGRHGSASCL